MKRYLCEKVGDKIIENIINLLMHPKLEKQ